MLAVLALAVLPWQAPGAAAVADTSPFRSLTLPTPGRIRTADGRPGPDYWQQRADYVIRASLDTAASVLSGTETIHYVNHSPDTLEFVWVQLDQNLFAASSITNLLNQPPLQFTADISFDFTGKGFVGGLTLDHFTAGGKELRRTILGTMMRVDLDRPLPPGGAIDFDAAWHFPVPPYGGGRMGRVGTTLYEMGQWYPRMAVYDDVHGWNTLPYIGPGEFYLEYGDFDVTLTLPAGFVVAATGVVQNPAEVYSPAEIARIARARGSDTAVAIITRAEALANAARRTPGTKTWHLTAANVRDFAWAASPRYEWDASDWDGTAINTFYRPEATPWRESNRMARATIAHFSESWFRYPYPQATTCEGLVEGMEYPMITFVPAIPDRHTQYWDLMHEFGHEWFPMVVGSDERRYPWMDEGFNTFIDYGAAEAYFKGSAYADTVRRELVWAAAAEARPGMEQPLITAPAEVRELYWTAYQKPALMLTLLRDAVLGPDEFRRAFREYIRRWQFKHPQPADFFRTMENVSGRDLSWFWRDWVFTTARLDQAVDSVVAGPDTTRIFLSNRASMVMPATVEIRYADGTAERRALPVEMWNLGDRFVYRLATPSRVARVTLDPDRIYPDVDRANNRWPR